MFAAKDSKSSGKKCVWVYKINVVDVNVWGICVTNLCHIHNFSVSEIIAK